MKFLNRTLLVGVTWAILYVVLLVVPLYVYGTLSTSTAASRSAVSPGGFLLGDYAFGPLPVFPVGLFVLGISFILALAIADPRAGIKVLCLSEIIAFTVSPLLVIWFPTPLTSLTPDGMIAFFGLMAVAFFLLGTAGTVSGSFLGMWIEEQPGRLVISLNRHRAVVGVAILVLVIGTSFVAVESLVKTQIQNAETVSSIKYVGVVANQTLNWATGVENVSTNFRLQGNKIEIAWTSSINVSFHVEEYPKPQYREDIAYSCVGTDYSCRLDCCSASYCGYALEFLNGDAAYSNGAFFFAMAWFHNDACLGSGCPSGWVHYEIRMWTV